MRCGGDRHLLMELQGQSDTLRDLISINQSHRELLSISIDILKNVVHPMTTETSHLEEKVWLFQSISASELNVSDVNIPKSGVPGKISISKSESISTLNETCEELSERVHTFTERLDNFYDDWKETEAKWRAEAAPDRSKMEKISGKERKGLVKLWKQRELIAAHGKSDFEDLKAEWDAVKGELDKGVMNCLRGVAKLKE